MQFSEHRSAADSVHADCGLGILLVVRVNVTRMQSVLFVGKSQVAARSRDGIHTLRRASRRDWFSSKCFVQYYLQHL